MAASAKPSDDAIKEGYDYFFGLSIEFCREILKLFDKKALLQVYSFEQYQKDYKAGKIGRGTGLTTECRSEGESLVFTSLISADSAEGSFDTPCEDLLALYLANNIISSAEDDASKGARRCGYLEAFFNKLDEAINKYLKNAVTPPRVEREEKAAGGAGGVVSSSRDEEDADTEGLTVVTNSEQVSMFGSLFIASSVNEKAGKLILKTWSLVSLLAFLKNSAEGLSRISKEKDAYEMVLEQLKVFAESAVKLMTEVNTLWHDFIEELSSSSELGEAQTQKYIVMPQRLIFNLLSQINVWLVAQELPEVKVLAPEASPHGSTASRRSSADSDLVRQLSRGDRGRTLRRSSAVYRPSLLSAAAAAAALAEVPGQPYLQLIQKVLLNFYCLHQKDVRENKGLERFLRAEIVIMDQCLGGTQDMGKDFYTYLLGQLRILHKMKSPELNTMLLKLGLSVEGDSYKLNGDILSQSMSKLPTEVEAMRAALGFASIKLSDAEEGVLRGFKGVSAREVAASSASPAVWASRGAAAAAAAAPA